MDVSRQASKGCGDLIFSSHLTFIINFCWMYAVMGACGRRARALRPGGAGGALTGRGGLLGWPAPVSGSGLLGACWAAPRLAGLARDRARPRHCSESCWPPLMQASTTCSRSSGSSTPSPPPSASSPPASSERAGPAAGPGPGVPSRPPPPACCRCCCCCCRRRFRAGSRRTPALPAPLCPPPPPLCSYTVDITVAL